LLTTVTDAQSHADSARILGLRQISAADMPAAPSSKIAIICAFENRFFMPVFSSNDGLY